MIPTASRVAAEAIAANPASACNGESVSGLGLPARTQRRNRAGLGGRWLPAGDRPGALAGPSVVGDARSTWAQENDIVVMPSTNGP